LVAQEIVLNRTAVVKAVSEAQQHGALNNVTRDKVSRMGREYDSKRRDSMERVFESSGIRQGRQLRRDRQGVRCIMRPMRERARNSEFLLEELVP
jgi:hypothetical protein